MMKRVNCSSILTKNEAELFKKYLSENNIYFEPSEIDDSVYFLCQMTDEELDKANEWIEAHFFE